MQDEPVAEVREGQPIRDAVYSSFVWSISPYCPIPPACLVGVRGIPYNFTRGETCVSERKVWQGYKVVGMAGMGRVFRVPGCVRSAAGCADGLTAAQSDG